MNELSYGQPDPRALLCRPPHDLRRTAARNLVRAGVAEPVAMRFTGHLTPSVFKRYAIVDETMLTEGAEKLSRLFSDTRQPERKVLPLER